MSTPSETLIDIVGVTKDHGAPVPLRILGLSCVQTDRMAISGFDAPAAETFVNLVTGAALPDAGVVRTAGRDTREIATDADWLASLDRFGLVTDRAVLIETLSVAANLALPLTLSIDPMSSETRAHVERLAAAVGVEASHLPAPVSTLTASDRVRLHLGRALASHPQMLLLEHPTAPLMTDAERLAFGQALRGAATTFSCGWLALSNDEVFIRASGARHFTLNVQSGHVAPRRVLASWVARLSGRTT